MAVSRNKPSPDPGLKLGQVLLAGLKGFGGLRCVLGLSGGRDSMVLLHALAQLRAKTDLVFSALHIHHGLSPNADAWAAFCQEFCKLWNVPLQIEHVIVDRASGEGLEGAARFARYAVFRRVDADLIMLAHHAGDQAETLLFNLLRGAGVRGASAMPRVRSMGPNSNSPRLFRPFLTVLPADIEAYCQHFELPHINDESNLDECFSRNFIRHRILPPIEARFSGATKRLSAAARRFGEAQQLLDELAELDLQKVRAAGGLQLAALHQLSLPRQRNLLRCWLAALPGETGLSEDGLEELCRQMREAGSDSQVERRIGDRVLRVWRGRLYVVPQGVNEPAIKAVRRWQGESVIDWSGGRLFFDPVRGSGIALRPGLTLEIHSRQGGERICLPGNRPSQAVRNLLQDAAVPPWERMHLPMVWTTESPVLVAIPGLGVAADFLAGPGEAGVELRWVPSTG